MTLRDRLAARLVGEVVILGTGNPLRGDDAAGCLVTRQVRERAGVRVIDAEDVPESYAGQVVAARPRAVVLIDSMDLGARPGSVALLERQATAAYFPSTHRMPLALLMEYVERETGADTFLLAIQPGQIGLGTPVSEEVLESAQLLAQTLNDVLAARRERATEPKSERSERGGEESRRAEAKSAGAHARESRRALAER